MQKMKILYSVIGLLFIVSGYGVAMGQGDLAKPADSQAATAEHADHASHGAGQSADQPAAHAGHDMSQMAGMDDMKLQEEAMAAHMSNMQALMGKIDTTADPAERKQLMAEHLALMASGMKMMREMDHKMTMGMMKSGKCPMMEMMASPQGHAGMQGMMGDMPMCHAMMQKKADRNFTMMEQIIESQKQLLKLVP